jgi:predicted DsbA family dithiol-disulfide isomerase
VPVHVLCITDPACPDSWGAEPVRRRLLAEFGDEVAITYVMGGRAREFKWPLGELRVWLKTAAATGMPVDGAMWLDAPPKSSYPACLAVKAAAEQDLDGRYLRRVREAFAIEGRRADTPDVLTDLASQVEGMNVDRFRVDLQSNAIVELLGKDLDVARKGELDVPRWEVEGETVDDVVGAVRAAGAASRELPSVEDALQRFGRMAVPEVAQVCDLAPPRAQAELWRLALDFRARPDDALSPKLWSAA